MAHNSIDLTGQRFNRLTVVERVGVNKQGSNIWKCKCECGNYKDVPQPSLKSGNTKSCGCARKTHGMYNSKIYHVWSAMKGRCERKTDARYKDYGGRGIKLHEPWEKFEPFYKWAMTAGYREGLSLDRIDNNGNYCPENCRWVTMKEQALNKSTNRIIAYNGESKPLTEWARLFHIQPGTLATRLRRGWSIERAMTTKTQKYTKTRQ